MILKNGARVIGNIYTYKFKNEEGSFFDNQLNLFNKKKFNHIQLLLDELIPSADLLQSTYLKKIKSYFKSEV